MLTTKLSLTGRSSAARQFKTFILICSLQFIVMVVVGGGAL
jgi:hypothetical protein